MKSACTACHFVPSHTQTAGDRHCTASHCSALSRLFTKSAPSNLKSKRLRFRAIIHIISTPLYLKELACPTACYSMKYEKDRQWWMNHPRGFVQSCWNHFPTFTSKTRTQFWGKRSVCGREIDLRVGILLKCTVVTDWAQQGSAGAAPGFRKLGIRWKWMSSCRIWPFYSQWTPESVWKQ